MNKFVGIIVALLACIGSLMVATPAQAATSEPECTSVHRAHMKKEDEKLIHRANVWWKRCEQYWDHKKHVWMKGTNWGASYDRDGIYGHLRYNCGPANNFNGVNYRLHVTNPSTGFAYHKKIAIGCRSDSAAIVHRSLRNAPRCYMPMVGGGGRVPLHRSHCHYRVSYEIRWWGARNVWGRVGGGIFV